MIAETLRRFVADELPIDARNKAAYGERGHDPAAWARLAELGIAGALFPEDAGGFGGHGFDIAVLFEELGRGLVVEPFLGSLMAGRALAVTGDHDRLAAIVAGETIVAFAHDEAGADEVADIAVRADRAGDGWRIEGTKIVVPHGEAAGLLLVTARTAGEAGERDGVSLFLVDPSDPGVTRRGYTNIDGGRSADIGFDAAPATLVGGEGAGAAAIEAATDAGLLALSAEALGAMEVVRDLTLDYLRTRQQFGVAIGKFQALQHRMADLLLEIEQARSAVINAAAAFDEPTSSARSRALAAAKYTAGRIGRMVAEEAVQLHGGIGMTWELPLSHYAKRLVMIDHQLGDEDHHLARYIALGRDAQGS
ncbi:alkylation response protein AidB-like acyl-CoA dehydrogenase [Sphingomonas jejuensis]|uniref:Alkylation response protein AidB-like acyl-CoA dehydrogenase n=2 Tax=Sphingomonas jejuensis TaxID=904715 RepID=A0ABX0XKG9_9SPHN|nr:alkylation response protein AidB-like acyl-CoA dehydrogenase [Sphingomonas jejuensis]